MATVKTRTRLTSRFAAVEEAKFELVRHARDVALEAGQQLANQKIERFDRQRDYNLDADVSKQNLGWQSGKILYDHWWGKFFEYGTVYIQAMPFMRPAHRRMRKVFLTVMGPEFEGFIKRKARLRTARRV